MIRQRVAASLAGRRRRTNSGVPPPPPESANRSLPDDNGGGGGESESFSSDYEEEEEERGRTGGGEAAGGKQPWKRVDQSVYEEQLEKLQEQLVQVMIENQALQAELEEQRKKPGSSQRRELDQLRQENTALQQRLRHQAVSTASSHTSVGSLVDGGYENVTTDRERVLKLRSRKRPLSRRFSYASARESVYNCLSLFSEDVRTPSNEPEEEATPLTAKRLKENCTRLGKSSKPWREMASHVKETVRWRNSAESLVVFLIYMYCVLNGWIVQLVVFISVIKLTLNYLHISGLAEQFGFSSGQTEEEADESMGLADKFQLVKQVAQTVQNTSGTTSDTLEKLRNLWLWHQPEATRKLYIALLVFLLVTLFLPNSYTLTFIGLFAGMKLFIVDNIYRKYPRVQEEFDDVDRMWRSLPTDAELLERQTLSREEMTSLLRQRSSVSVDGGSVRGERGEGGGVSPHHISDEDAGFCSRFDLPTSEVPFPDWQGGRRCTLIDRDRPLMGSRGGRLYLTYSFLCFERLWNRDSDRLVLPLSDIAEIEKAKPFAVLPGNGMAIEVTLKNSDKYMFGAILNRDQSLSSILEQGLMLGLPWGADPDDLSTQNHTPSLPSNTTTNNNNNQNSESAPT